MRMGLATEWHSSRVLARLFWFTVFFMLMSTLGFSSTTSLAGQTLPRIEGAKNITYESIRDHSAVLTFAEPILPESLAPSGAVVQTVGVSLVNPDDVAGAYRLPMEASIDSLKSELALSASISGASEYRNGQLWKATLDRAGKKPLVVLYIDGTHPSFLRDQAPELRPAEEKYLIFYSLP